MDRTTRIAEIAALPPRDSSLTPNTSSGASQSRRDVDRSALVLALSREFVVHGPQGKAGDDRF